MYRRINPASLRELPLGMLFQPTGAAGFFHRACEADSFRGLVAAILDDPSYESADIETGLIERLRLADDIALIADMDGRQLSVGDRDGSASINVASDESLIRSLDRLGFVSLQSGQRESEAQAREGTENG